MVLVKELHKKCKELGIKGYSKLKKADLENLLKSHGQVMEQPPTTKKWTVVQLKKKCKEMKVKNCSKKKKAELLQLVDDKKQKKTVDPFQRKKRIQQMKKLVDEDFDPIYGQEFETWSDEDLQNAILLGNHFYLPETLLHHVEAKMKQQHVIKDPMLGTIIPDDKIKEIYKANKKQYKKIEKFHFDTANMNVKLDRHFFKLFPNRPAQPFMQIILTYNPNIYTIKTKNPYFKKPDEILIGNVPMGISTEPEAGQVKALDTGSTSEVIMSKILQMIRSGKLFSNRKDNKLTVDTIQHLPKTTNAMKKWYNAHRRLDTTSTHSEYFKLLNEL